jgi:hypothetical protein
MKELLDISFAPANFLLTLLSIVMLLYWLFVIFTGFNIDGPDVDIDADVEADFENPDLVGQPSGQGFWSGFLEFLYIGELPILFIISIVVFSMWFINVNVTAIFGLSHNLFGFLLYFPNFILSMLITKVVAKPFVKLYAFFNHKGEEPIDFIGKVGKTTSPVSKDKLGQIQIQLEEDVLKVYAKAIDDELIPYGETVMILEESLDKKYYLVQKYTN